MFLSPFLKNTPSPPPVRKKGIEHYEITKLLQYNHHYPYNITSFILTV